MLAEVKAAPHARARRQPDKRLTPALQELRPARVDRRQGQRKLSLTRAAAAVALVLSSAALVVSAFVAFQTVRIAGEVRAERVERAWSTLLRPAGGNTGKAEALGHLWASGQILDGTDLSCKNIGDYDAAGSRCGRAPRFAGLRLDYFERERSMPDGRADADALGNPDVRSVDLRDAVIDQARIDRMSFTQSKFDRMRVVGSVLSAVRLEGSMRGMRVSRSTLTDSWLEGDITDAEISDSDISGLTFVGFDPGRPISLKRNWAWADMPPSVLSPTHEGYDANLGPVPDAVLRLVRLCMPPLTAKGAVVPLDMRRHAGERNEACQPMSVIASKYLFPDAYGVTDGRASWIDRQAAAFAGIVRR